LRSYCAFEFEPHASDSTGRQDGTCDARGIEEQSYQPDRTPSDALRYDVIFAGHRVPPCITGMHACKKSGRDLKSPTPMSAAERLGLPLKRTRDVVTEQGTHGTQGHCHLLGGTIPDLMT